VLERGQSLLRPFASIVSSRLAVFFLVLILYRSAWQRGAAVIYVEWAAAGFYVGPAA
jgi:hypothetical protein